MNSPRNIKIPDHWLIDIGVTTYWPHKEGIWVDNQTAPLLRLVCVYHGLMDIPEAKNQLTKCNEQFIDENAGGLLHFFKPVIQQARAGSKVTATDTPFQSEAEGEKAAAIYRTWVDTWALGSDKMLEWVIGFNVTTTILNFLGFNRQALRRFKNRLTELGSQFSPPWVWKTLLSGEYHRLDQTRRELARRTVQSQGFYHLRERQLLTGAYYWIAVRILLIKPKDLLDELNRRSNTPIKLTEQNLSEVILKPFDNDIGYDREPGRPKGVKATESIRTTKSVLG